MIFALILATLSGTSLAKIDIWDELGGKCAKLSFEPFASCMGMASPEAALGSILNLMDDMWEMEKEFCKKDSKWADCLLFAVKDSANLRKEKEKKKCVKAIEKTEMMFEFLLGQEGLLCMTDDKGTNCMLVMLALDLRDDPCELYKRSCCYINMYQYAGHCGVAPMEPLSAVDVCPDVDMTATCPGPNNNIKAMSCFEPAKEAPTQPYSDISPIKEFCETGSMGVDQAKCSLWSCCKWNNGQCSANLSTVGSDCTCDGDGLICDASIASTFKLGESGAASMLSGLAAVEDASRFVVPGFGAVFLVGVMFLAFKKKQQVERDAGFEPLI